MVEQLNVVNQNDRNAAELQRPWLVHPGLIQQVRKHQARNAKLSRSAPRLLFAKPNACKHLPTEGAWPIFMLCCALAQLTSSFGRKLMASGVIPSIGVKVSMMIPCVVVVRIRHSS